MSFYGAPICYVISFPKECEYWDGNITNDQYPPCARQERASRFSRSSGIQKSCCADVHFLQSSQDMAPPSPYKYPVRRAETFWLLSHHETEFKISVQMIRQLVVENRQSVNILLKK